MDNKTAAPGAARTRQRGCSQHWVGGPRTRTTCSAPIEAGRRQAGREQQRSQLLQPGPEAGSALCKPPRTPPSPKLSTPLTLAGYQEGKPRQAGVRAIYSAPHTAATAGGRLWSRAQRGSSAILHPGVPLGPALDTAWTGRLGAVLVPGISPSPCRRGVRARARHTGWQHWGCLLRGGTGSQEGLWQSPVWTPGSGGAGKHLPQHRSLHRHSFTLALGAEPPESCPALPRASCCPAPHPCCAQRGSPGAAAEALRRGSPSGPSRCRLGSSRSWGPGPGCKGTETQGTDEDARARSTWVWRGFVYTRARWRTPGMCTDGGVGHSSRWTWLFHVLMTHPLSSPAIVGLLCPTPGDTLTAAWRRLLLTRRTHGQEPREPPPASSFSMRQQDSRVTPPQSPAQPGLGRRGSSWRLARSAPQGWSGAEPLLHTPKSHVRPGPE